MENGNIVVNNKDAKLVDLSTIKKMSIKDIENYGASIQELIDTKSSEILAKTKMNDIGNTKDKLDDLQEVVDKQKKLLTNVLLPIRAIKKFVGGYEKVQSRIDNITNSIVEQKDKLDEYVEYMIEQTESIGCAVKQLYEHEEVLKVYSEELETENNPDQIRLQAVANRLKLITSTRVNAEQAQVETLMIIKANQESKYQLAQVVQNVVPILKMQAVNAIGIRANRESMDIAEKTRKITGDLIVKNAEDINNMAKDLQKNRTNSPIDEEKLMKAQSILIDAMKTVKEASELEVATNLRVARNLRESAESNSEYINVLKEKI